MGDLVQSGYAAAPPDFKDAPEDMGTFSTPDRPRPDFARLNELITGRIPPNRRDIMQVLPLELVHECFRLLYYWKERVAVSHVSHAWRLAAISDRRLWTEFILPTRSMDVAVHALSTYLARSDPLPFTFDYFLRDDAFPQAIFDLVSSNLHRISKFYVDHELLMLRLIQLDAPLLTRIKCRSLKEGVPAQWGRNAPRLECLHTSVLNLPSDSQPFAALRKLDIQLPYGGVLDISFLHVFPNLKKLKLHNVTAKSLPMLTPLPRLLENVDLYIDKMLTLIVDYGPFLRGVLAPCKIQQINLPRATSFIEALVLFLTVCKGPWKLELQDGHLRFDDVLVRDVRWSVRCYSSMSLFAEGCCVEHLARLAELDMPVSALFALNRIPARGAWDRRLPSLRVLKLNIDDQEVDAAVSRRTAVSAASEGTSMPALEVVELHVYYSRHAGLGDWLVRDAPALLHAHCGHRTLETVRVMTVRDGTLPGAHVLPLLQVAERVVVCNWSRTNRLFQRGFGETERAVPRSAGEWE